MLAKHSFFYYEALAGELFGDVLVDRCGDSFV